MMKRKILLALLFLILAITASAFGALTALRNASAGKLYSNLTGIPHRRVGLVLGCKRAMGDGTLNPFFVARIQAATELYKAGKIDYFLVSGDNHTQGYDEATAMRDGLMQAGVPADRIYSDCAGFRTLDSIVRARDVFGLSQLTVISQEFHNQRAIFLASHSGVDAIGFNAPDADLGDFSGTHKRERMARLKAVLDIYVLRTKPHFLGANVSIGTDPPSTCSASQVSR
jgi:SanA protein